LSNSLSDGLNQFGPSSLLILFSRIFRSLKSAPLDRYKEDNA
jgi:hypothetical protein